MLGVLAKNKRSDYKNCIYKSYFSEDVNVRFHVIDFLKNFAKLYDLLKYLPPSN